MNAGELTALQALARRELEPEEIAEIDGLLPSRRDDLIAGIVSDGRTTIVSHEIGIGTILMALAPAGGAFLDGLVALGETDRNVFWSLELIKQGRFDVGLAGTRLQMQALAQQMPDLAGAFGTLLALAEREDPVSVNEVSAALNALEV